MTTAYERTKAVIETCKILQLLTLDSGRPLFEFPASTYTRDGGTTHAESNSRIMAGRPRER
jgi:hypothetical protein